MKRDDLAVGMEVKLDSRWRAGMSDHAIILDLTPGWTSEGPRRPWFAFTDPNGAYFTRKQDDGSVVRWGDRFRIGSKRNNNVAVALEIRRRIDGTNETEHSYWEPAVMPLAQIQQPWAQWQATLAQQEQADRERNAALYARKAERQARWEAELLPVLLYTLPEHHSLVHKLGMDYVDMRHPQNFHQFPAHVLEMLLARIAKLEEGAQP